MRKISVRRYSIHFLLLFSFIVTGLPVRIQAQTVPAVAPADYAKGLASIEEKLEKRRKELGIPGLSLAIVKDGKVIYSKGLGYKDFENKVGVTPETQFAIGSATKAFTALSVLMSVDEGKVDLDASPKKYLPYFKMYDPETDKNMTVRDLMDHSSGLNRTDLAMITGKLSRRELIEVAGLAKPMAKLREKFFYQNIMYAAAGEVTATVNNTTFEKFIPERIFKPLGMTNSNISIAEMQKAPDRSLGYDYNFDTKQTRLLPYRPIDDVSPAGAINSSANDMAKWINFVLAGGVVNGKRLVSEKSYEEWTKPQMKVTPNGKVSYGLGWFLQDWNGLKVIQHGGNIDGFNSMVAMIPEKNIGFVLLTNVTGSPLGNELMPVVWTNILGDPNPTQTVELSALEKEVGIYNLAVAKLDFDVKLENGKLVMVVPGQPPYVLENVGGRRYKMTGAPDGFFATFKDDSLYLEQPQGNYDLQKKNAASKTADTAKELVGKYTVPGGKGTVEIKSETDGRVTFNIEGQQPYALVEKAKDEFSLTPLPPAYFLKVKRVDGKLAAVVISQPEGEFEFTVAKDTPATTPAISADELMAKVIAASGGEANLRKLTSRVVEADLDAVNQGVKGTSVSYAKAPNMTSTETTFLALGKVIGNGFEYFDGTGGAENYTFSQLDTFAGKRLEDVRINADFYGALNWKSNYKTVVVKGSEKVGDEDCWVVELVPEKGTKITQLYSKTSFLLLRQRGVNPSSTSENSQPYVINFSDYRDVDGVKIPFKTVNESQSMGEIVTVIKSVKHNVAIDDKMFKMRKLK